VTPELRSAYLKTAYVVRAPSGVHALRIGETHPAFDAEVHAAGARAWAVVTAWNPASQRRPHVENERAQAELLRAVAELGVSAWTAEGRADAGGWREESLCVLGLDAPEAIGLGRRFGQLAIVVGRHAGAAELLEVPPA
jgi:hypothetical protein